MSQSSQKKSPTSTSSSRLSESNSSKKSFCSVGLRVWEKTWSWYFFRGQALVVRFAGCRTLGFQGYGFKFKLVLESPKTRVPSQPLEVRASVLSRRIKDDPDLHQIEVKKKYNRTTT